jgi:phenylacetate-CoA ligase
MIRAGGAPTLQQLTAELQLTERLPAAEIEQQQSLQLAALVAHHARHTPAFSARLRRAHLAAADVDSVATLARLPLLSRREIQNLGASFYSRQIPADHEPTAATMTSGSTGEPVKVRKSSRCRLYWGANTVRDHRWNGRDVTGRLLSIRPTITARAEGVNWGFPMAALGHTGPALGLPTAMDLTEHVRCIDEFQPQTLLVFPNLLDGLLGEWERRGSPPPGIRHFKTVGETVRDELRERVQRICGLRVEDSYSSQECGIVAMQCPDGLYHVMAESVLVEVLDDAGHPCEPGQSGRLVVTDLRNLASPLIRYEIGDVAVRGGACRCGLQLPTLQYIMGRDRNLLARPDGSRRYPIIGFHMFHKVAPVLQFRFIQHSLHEIELIVHTRVALDRDQEAALAKIVQAALDYPFEVRITHSATPLQRSAGGKFEDFISKVPA